MWLPGTRHILIFLLSIVLISVVYFQFRVQHIWRSHASVPSVLQAPPLVRTKNSTNELTRFNKAANRKKGQKRTTAFIVTQMRSGSSLVGEIFNEHPRCFYFFEPLHAVRYYQDHAHDTELMQIRMLDSISRCEFGGLEEFMSFFLDTRASHFGGMRKSRTLQRLCRKYPSSKGRVCPIPRNAIVDKLGGVCKSSNFTVVKTIRVNDVRLFRAIAESNEQAGNDVKIVHLVRDPRGVVASNLAIQFKDVNPFSDDKVNTSKVQNLCNWMLRNVQFKHKAKDWLQGRYTLVRFEDIATSPFRLVKQLYTFLGVTPHSAIFRWLRENTNVTKQSKDPYSPKGNLKETTNSWRRRLSISAVKKIQQTCGDAMRLFGYRLVHEQTDLQNNSLSLMGNLNTSVIHIK